MTRAGDFVAAGPASSDRAALAGLAQGATSRAHRRDAEGAEIRLEIRKGQDRRPRPHGLPQSAQRLHKARRGGTRPPSRSEDDRDAQVAKGGRYKTSSRVTNHPPTRSALRRAGQSPITNHGFPAGCASSVVECGRFSSLRKRSRPRLRG